MNLIIFGDTFTFPEGSAATNRVYTYAKGFNENHIKVHVICFASEYNTVGDGIDNGVHYYHPFGCRKRSKYFLVRFYQKQLKYFKTCNLLRTINDEEKIIAINIWTSLFCTHLFAWFLTKTVKTKLIVESSEHPLRYYQNGRFKKILGVFKFKLESNMCDGVFCISQYLIDFYAKYGVSRKKLFLVPSTVDTDRFNAYNKSPLNFSYILYCGSMTIIKDGVNILIESFSRISTKYPEMNLVLIGKYYSPMDEKYINDLIASLNVSKRVIYLGSMPRKEIPAYLCNAKILVLARPQSMVADAGFPSKLTEYIATGRPVVVTNVGEISLYLRDNENVFISEPGSIDAFADKLDFVLSNYKYSEQVGQRGKELTKTVFNYNFQAKRMIEFIGTISNYNGKN